MMRNGLDKKCFWLDKRTFCSGVIFCNLILIDLFGIWSQKQSQLKLLILSISHQQINQLIRIQSEWEHSINLRIVMSLNSLKKSFEKDVGSDQSKNKILQLFLKVQQLNNKNQELLEEVHSQTTLVLKYSKYYKQQLQKKSKHLQYVLQQVQKQAENAKFYWVKAFKEQVQKIKHLQKLNKQLHQQNIKLSSQVSVRSQNNQSDLLTQLFAVTKSIQDQKYHFQVERSKLQSEKSQFTKLLTEKDEMIGRLQEKIKTYELKEGRWNEVAKEFKREKEEKQVLINQLNNELKRLKQELWKADAKQKGKSGISNQSTQSADQQHSKKSQSQHQKQPYQWKQKRDPFEYITKLSQRAQLPQNQILVRQGDYYFLNHSNMEVQMQEFLSYDWSLLQELNFYNSRFNNEKWKCMVEEHDRFPNLEVVYLRN